MGPQPSMSASIELPARAVSGIILIVAAVLAVFAGGIVFGCFVIIGAVAGLREWHRLVNDGKLAPQMFITAISLMTAVALFLASSNLGLALAVISAGVVCTLVWSSSRGQSPVWHAVGTIYLGIPAIALVMLRGAADGAHLLLGILLAVWSADTGALFGGRFIGGPKLVPKLSPNKTWAGFICGTFAAGLVEALFVGLLGGSATIGLSFGIAIALFGHAGDLFESWVKRRFQAKDSGSLIPGHGGVLDRIDSLLFVAPVCAFLVFLTGLNPFQGASP